MGRGQYYNNRLVQIEVEDDIKEECQGYFLEPNYSYLDPVYFEDWDEVAHCIKVNMDATKSADKWVIFVRKERTGKELVDKLHDLGIDDVVFLTAKSKKDGGIYERETYKEIVETEAFSQKVLIATKALDNGVNLKDPALKHIVIDYFEETTFLQMLGRKRRVDGQGQVELFLRNVSEGNVRKMFRKDILVPVVFWRRLMRLKNEDRPENGDQTLDNFCTQYMDGGQYKRPFDALISLANVQGKSAGEMRVQDDKYIMIDLYEPEQFAMEKVTYEYYQMMAMFERMQEDRVECYKKFIEECIENQYTVEEVREYGLSKEQAQWIVDETKLMACLKRLIQQNPNNQRLQNVEREIIWVDSKAPEIEPFLQQTQYMWIWKQISWMRFYDEKYNPVYGENWALFKYGITFHYKEQFADSLASVVSEDGEIYYLSEAERKQLKGEFSAWISSVRPKHRHSKSKGSISVINACLKEYNLPYRIESKKKLIQGRQGNWWMVLREPQV